MVKIKRSLNEEGTGVQSKNSVNLQLMILRKIIEVPS